MKLSIKNIDRLGNIADYVTNNGTKINVSKRGESFLVKISRSKDNCIEFHWVWETSCLQSASTWLNKILNKPLKCKFFESGTWLYPHNKGMGNNSGKRQTYTHGASE
jgi:hypothetical protein